MVKKLFRYGLEDGFSCQKILHSWKWHQPEVNFTPPHHPPTPWGIIAHSTQSTSVSPSLRKRVCFRPWSQMGEEQHSLVGGEMVDPVRTTEKKALQSVYSVSPPLHITSAQIFYRKKVDLSQRSYLPSALRIKPASLREGRLWLFPWMHMSMVPTGCRPPPPHPFHTRKGR